MGIYFRGLKFFTNFAGTNFRGLEQNKFFAGINFRGFGKKPRKLIPAKINSLKVLSECTFRSDHKGIEKKVQELNNRFHDFGKSKNLAIVRHDDINKSCLGKKKLHLNNKGKSILAIDFKNFISAC